MITAVANGEGVRIILLGLSRENVTRLMADQPIRVTAESHPGFPADLVVYIMGGETERSLTDAIKSFIGDETKIVAVPRTHPGIS
jgi:hypothetical protein